MGRRQGIAETKEYIAMNDLERDVLRLWDRAVSPENIAKYLMVSEDYVLNVIEAPGNYEEKI